MPPKLDCMLDDSYYSDTLGKSFSFLVLFSITGDYLCLFLLNFLFWVESGNFEDLLGDFFETEGTVIVTSDPSDS